MTSLSRKTAREPGRKTAHRTAVTTTAAVATRQDPRWAAVVARDATADGAFVYSVRTTGVYCRPSCPSRLADPRNVRFHADGEDARRAGFRACKRCRPDQATVRGEQAGLVARLCRVIEAAEAAPSLAALAGLAGLSAFHVQRMFKRCTGLTPKAYAQAHRARRLRAELDGGQSVTAAMYGAGYGSSGTFYRAANGVLGMTPGAWRAGGAGATIRFAIGQCTLGAILVAATARGVCAILLGDDPDALARDLQDRFPRATLVGADADFEATVARVVGLVEWPARGNDLPLDIRGTAFQQRVWQALMMIPAGSTVSYAELARRLGTPAATRAVAGACAVNALAVVIPCHRVVRTDGSLSGYRWGVERKRALLDREAGR